MILHSRKPNTIVLFILLFVFYGCGGTNSNPVNIDPNEPPQPGDQRDFSLGNTGVSITMCWIPAGSFIMGAQIGEEDAGEDEYPPHEVEITEGFWMGKYEVTQAQWEAVMGSNQSEFYGANRPAESVSWEDTQTFESMLLDSFRLPSEAEWEYACRAGTTTRFYWGDDSECHEVKNFAVFRDNSLHGTANVGVKRPNAWNLYDMSGNVCEWCEDVYQSEYTDAIYNVLTGVASSGEERVRRGGSWSDIAQNCRSANRFINNAPIRYNIQGFRLVRDAD